MKLLLLGLGAFTIGGALFAYLFSNWQRALIGVLLLVVFEGALRKWVLPQASDYIYFLKDLMLIPIYLRTFSLSDSYDWRTKIPAAFGLLLSFNLIWGTIQVFNPSLGSPLVGMLGWRAYFYYIPLMWLVPRLFADQAALVRFLRGYLLLTIPIGLLGMVQYTLPASHPLNFYAGGSEASAWVGDAVRITSTFPYIAGYVTYLTVTFALLLPFLFTSQSRLWRWITLIELALVVGNGLMTGSRGVVFAQILILLLFILVNGLRHPGFSLSRIMQLLLPSLILAASIFVFYERALDNFITRATSSDSVVERFVGSAAGPLDVMSVAGFDGYGIGASLPGRFALTQSLRLPLGQLIPIGFETEPSRVILEIGPFGFLLWYGLRFYLLTLQWKMFRQLCSPFLQHLALAALTANLLLLNGSLVINPTAVVYYWWLNGLIFLLPHLDRQRARDPITKSNQIHDLKVFIPRPSYR